MLNYIIILPALEFSIFIVIYLLNYNKHNSTINLENKKQISNFVNRIFRKIKVFYQRLVIYLLWFLKLFENFNLIIKMILQLLYVLY